MLIRKSKREIIRPFELGRKRILDLVNDLLDDDVKKSSFDKDWSIKDVFSHLCYWDWWKISAIDQILLGILPPYFDDEDDEYVNEREIVIRQKRDWAAILHEFESASKAFLKKLDTLNEEDFYYVSGIKLNGEEITIAWLLNYIHYNEHIDQITQWRKEKGI